MSRGLLLALILSLCAFAQTNNGRISGSVSDTSGAVIPNATVVVTNQATSVTRRTKTDANGFYVVTNLPVSVFSVEIEAAGFRRAQRNGYDLDDAGHITADFRLDVGAVTESVEVTEVIGETVNL